MSDQPALKYAVLWHHDISEPHYDLLVETYPGSDLATWRSPVWPIETLIVLQRLRDHRRIYLEYEGDLSGHRGRVERIGSGNCTVSIGEGAVWRIKLLNIAIDLLLTEVGDGKWEATQDSPNIPFSPA